MDVEPVEKILLIEDNIDDARLIQEMLNDAGSKYRIITGDGLSSAMKLLEREALDAVLLDLRLPDSDGMDTLRKLQDRKPDLPVVVLTGLTDEELAVEAI